MTQEELKASQEKSQDDLTQEDATEKLTKQVKENASALQNDIVATKTDELSAKVDASMLVSSSKNTDRPTREELKTERKELREERREDKKLNRLISGLKKEIAKTSVAKQELNKTTGEYNLLMMNLEDLRNFNDYLMKVRNKTIDPAKEKFQPQNLESFLAMLMQMPYGKGYIEFVGKNGKVAKSGGSNVEYGVVQGTTQSNDNLGSKIPKKIEKNFEKGGLVGMLNGRMDQTNMTPGQKAFRSGTSNLLALGGAVFVGRKMLSSAFKLISDKEERKGAKLAGNLAWIAIPTGLTLAANATSGGNLMDLLKGGKLSERMSSNRFGGGSESNNKKTEFAKTYNEGLLGTGALFGGLKFGEMKQLLEKDENGGIKLSQEGKEKMKLVYQSKPDDEKSKLALKVLESNNPEADKIINMGLTAVIGDYDTLMQKKDDELFDKSYAENIARFSSIAGYLKEHKYTTINIDEYKKEITEYIRTGKPTLDELDKMGVFLGTVVEIKKDSNREALKNKVNKLEEGKTLKIKIRDEDVKLFKINGTSEVGMESEDGKITLINLDYPSIKGLGIDSSDRKFTDTEGNNNYYELFLTANQLNKLKNKYEGRIYAAGGNPFKFEKGEIYFNEAKAGGGIITDKVVNESILGYFYFSSFPQAFKGQEQMIVNYLNKEVKTSPETMEEVIKYFQKRNMGVELANGFVKSHGESIKIDTTTRKIEGLDRQFQNYLELIGAANLINTFKQILKERQAQSKDPIYTGIDGNIAFNDRTIFEEMKTYLNKGPQGYGDTDIVKAGNLTFRKENTLKSISPTLYANRKEFVNYLNKVSGFKEYVPEDREAKELAKIKKKISETLNDGIDPAIDFGEDSMEYNKEQKKLIIKGIDEKKIQNDKLIENLGELNNLVSRYNVLQSQYVNKIELPNINLKPGETISVKYLKKLLDFNENKIQLGSDILANKEMIKYVIEKKYSEGRFTIEENTNLDMNGIVILKYIYENGYDFDRLFDGEDDSRLDFTMRVMQLLSEGQTIIDPDHKKELLKIKGAPIVLKPNHDPILERRRMSIKEDINYAKDLRGIKNWFYTARNDNILEKIAKYYNENYPNIADRQD